MTDLPRFAKGQRLIIESNVFIGKYQLVRVVTSAATSAVVEVWQPLLNRWSEPGRRRFYSHYPVADRVTNEHVVATNKAIEKAFDAGVKQLEEHRADCLRRLGAGL